MVESLVEFAQSATLTSSLLDIVVRVTLILAAAFMIDRILMRTHQTLACSSTWNAAMAGLVLLPLLSFLIVPKSNWLGLVEETVAKNQIVTTISDSSTEPTEISNSNRPESLDRESKSASLATATAKASHQPRSSYQIPVTHRVAAAVPIVLILFLVTGYVVAILKLLTAMISAKRLRKTSVPATNSIVLASWSNVKARLQMGHDIPVRVSNSIRVPLAIGVLKPCVLLPSEYQDLKTENCDHVESILLHELTHVRRADLAWNMISQIALTMHWFHPLVWYARARMSDVVERACDDYCINSLGQSEYGKALLKAAEALVGPPPTTAGLAAVRKPKLAQRIQAIGKSHGNKNYLSGRPIQMALLASVLISIGLFSNFTIFRVKATSIDDDVLPVFTESRKKKFATLLDNGQKPVADPEAVLKKLIEANRIDTDRLTTWQGKLEVKTFDDTDGEIETASGSGEFKIDLKKDSIYSKIKWKPNGNRYRIGYESINTPEHLLQRELHSRKTVFPGPPKAVTGECVIRKSRSAQRAIDPRNFRRGHDSAYDRLTRIFEFQKSTDRHWERASLTSRKTEKGIEYSYRSLSSTDGLKTDKGLGLFEMKFSESSGFRLTGEQTNMLSILKETWTYDLKLVDGDYVPIQAKETRVEKFGNGATRNSSRSIQVTENELNKKLPKDLFTLQNFNLTENERYLDSIQNKLYKIVDGKLMELENFDSGNSSNDIDRGPNAGSLIQLMRSSRFRLEADQDGRLSRIEDLTYPQVDGERNWISGSKEVREQIGYRVKQFGTAIGQHAMATLIVDPKLKADELNRFKKEIQFEVETESDPKIVIPGIVTD